MAKTCHIQPIISQVLTVHSLFLLFANSLYAVFAQLVAALTLEGP
jgi:hypothetical protein